MKIYYNSFIETQHCITSKVPNFKEKCLIKMCLTSRKIAYLKIAYVKVKYQKVPISSIFRHN